MVDQTRTSIAQPLSVVPSHPARMRFIVNNGRINTAKHITLSMTLESMTGRKKLVTVLNRLGHCVNYHCVHASDYLKRNKVTFTQMEPCQTSAWGLLLTSCPEQKRFTMQWAYGISTKLVKDLKDAIASPISTIINNSLTMGYVPDMAKLAKVIPIYKTKDNKNI